MISRIDKRQIIKLLKIGENQEVEFKESKNKLSKSLWETYSSFANTKGGFIILGIKEDKKTKICAIEGVENANNILKDFWSIINNKEKISSNVLDDSDVKIIDIDNKQVIVIQVPRVNRRNKPIYINNNPITGTYKRYHEGDYKCSKEELRVMASESSEESKDGTILKEFDINNLDKETIDSYRTRFKIHKGDNHEWNNLSNKDFLCMIRAIDRKTNKLTLAGLLMFGKNEDILEIIPRFFLDYREADNFITTERWSNRITSSPDEMWIGNLWSFFVKIVNRLTSDIPTPFVLDKDLMRIDNTEIHESVRERTYELHSACRLFGKWEYSNRKGN